MKVESFEVREFGDFYRAECKEKPNCKNWACSGVIYDLNKKRLMAYIKLLKCERWLNEGLEKKKIRAEADEIFKKYYERAYKFLQEKYPNKKPDFYNKQARKIARKKKGLYLDFLRIPRGFLYRKYERVNLRGLA